MYAAGVGGKHESEVRGVGAHRLGLVCRRLPKTSGQATPTAGIRPRHLYAYGKLGAGADGKAGKAKTGDVNRRRST